MGISLDDLKRESNRGLAVSNNAGLATLKNSLQTSNSNSLDDRINNMASSVLPQAAEVLKNSAELISLFDKSSSCKGTELATINGFNDLIQKEKKSGFPMMVTTILFNEEDTVIHDGLNINLVKPFNYVARGGTALYDSLCRSLKKALERHEKSGSKAPNKTVVAIMTDGNDQHSRYYGLNDAKKIIAECKALGWEFIFLGNEIDAKYEAAKLGIDALHAENYSLENNGISHNFRAVSNVLKSLREAGKIDPNWSASIKNNNLALGDGRRYSDDDSALRLGGKK